VAPRSFRLPYAGMTNGGAQNRQAARALLTVASARVADFLPGCELCAAFDAEVVAPPLRDTAHAGALWGPGSDVLGYDTAQSTDHGWGPRLSVFAAQRHVAATRATLDAGLPFRGRPMRYGWDEVAVAHHVRVATLG